MEKPQQKIGLKHGSGGRAMRQLIEEVFLELASPVDGIGLSALDDGAALKVGDQWLVVTTDSHVVHPIFFPGGDIGRLSVCGTVNDLAMMGATEPLGLTCAVILEEGFLREDLERIRDSMKAAAAEAGAPFVTGDTKVMGRGELDGIVLNTTGVALTRRVVSDAGLRAGDLVIVTGQVGDHGMAIMARRHDLGLQGDLRSDVAPINGLIRLALQAGGDDVVAMKDPTRGGVAGSLHEMAAKGQVGIVIEEQAVPVRQEVRAAADMLGIDPLLVANEGKAVIGVRAASAEKVLAALRGHPLGRDAAIVAHAISERPGSVILDTGLGRRLLAEPEGELLPHLLSGSGTDGPAMHEYALVEALITRVEAEARKRQAVRVHALSVRVGELAGVDPELFQTAYDTFRAGTLCAETTLTVKRIPAGWSCPRCGAAIPRGEVLRCAACDLPARLDDGADALTLDGIDLEVP